MAKQPRLDTSTIKKTRWAWLVGTFFGAGLLRPGPGTYGSVAAVLLWFGAIHGLHLGFTAQTIATIAAAVFATAMGIPAPSIVAR